MSIDTRTKRASAMFISSPWRVLFPLPDGTVEERDRATAAFMYSGLSYSGVVPPVDEGGIYIPTFRRRRR